MKDYVNMQFVPATDIIAEVKETLRSYFETGVIDDVLFPTWINDCLRRFKMAQYKITDTVLNIQNYTAELPPEFRYVREAWMTAIVDGFNYPTPNYTYYTQDYVIDMRNDDDRCYQCEESPCCCADECQRIHTVTYKSNGMISYKFKNTFPLQPGNIHARNQCCGDSINLCSNAPNTFDIHGCDFVTNFECAKVYLTYYADASHYVDDIMVPDDRGIRNFLVSYLIYKCYDQLFHSVTDETFNQIQAKMQYYDMKQGEAFIDAQNKLKLQTVQQIKDSMKKTRLRYSRFNIPF